MRLLNRTEAQSSLRKENDELVATNVRLRHLWQEIIGKLNTARESYESEKMKKLQEFEIFCKDILEKKSKLLEELMGIEKEIKAKKDLYFGLISKQDALDEKIYQMKEQEKKLDLREAFVGELESKWKEHADVYNTKG